MRHFDDRAPVPSLKELKKHAEKFGSDSVVETAAELGYGPEALVRLMDACDRITSAALRKTHPNRSTPRFGDSVERVNVLLGLDRQKTMA